MVKHPIKDELHQVAIFIAVIWGVFLLDFVVPGDFTHFGVIPRTLRGIIGIVASPFLHGGFGHIASNTVPLAILLVLLAGSRARSWMIVAAVSIGGGTLLWLFGRTAIHVGASGLIYGLIAFLIVSGILERRLVPMIISIGVGFAYGSTLLSGVLPTVGGNVSWDGHLTGAIAGACVAWGLVRESSKDQ